MGYPYVPRGFVTGTLLVRRGRHRKRPFFLRRISDGHFWRGDRCGRCVTGFGGELEVGEVCSVSVGRAGWTGGRRRRAAGGLGVIAIVYTATILAPVAGDG